MYVWPCVYVFILFLLFGLFICLEKSSRGRECLIVVHASNILKCFISVHYLAGLNFIKVRRNFARRCNTLNLHEHSYVSRDTIKQALCLMVKCFVVKWRYSLPVVTDIRQSYRCWRIQNFICIHKVPKLSRERGIRVHLRNLFKPKIPSALLLTGFLYILYLVMLFMPPHSPTHTSKKLTNVLKFSLIRIDYILIKTYKLWCTSYLVHTKNLSRTKIKIP